jgi:hypothetical protein
LSADGVCAEHGLQPPLRRPETSSYEAFAAHLRGAGRFPTYLPWPMSPGWSVTDFAYVEGPLATLTCVSGTSQLDGPVDALVVAEEAGVGLGARCAGLGQGDPGPEWGSGTPPVRVRIGSKSIGMWPVSVSEVAGELDRSVVAGEAAGRWLWIVMRPASAMLLLRDDWILRDVSGVGPPLVEMPFAGPRPPW